MGTSKPFNLWKADIFKLLNEFETTVKVLESYMEQAEQTSKANFAALRARFSQPAKRFDPPKRQYSYKRASAVTSTLQRAAYPSPPANSAPARVPMNSRVQRAFS